MIKRFELFLVTIMFIIISAILLIVNNMHREQEFKSNNIVTQNAIISGATFAINLQLLEKKRHVQLFANEYASSLLQLNNDPANIRIQQDIKTRLKQRFPDFFTYTITDEAGRPKLENMEGDVGGVCKVDLINYAKGLTNNSNNIQNNIFIHPQPFHYHYDIMAPFYTNGEKPGVFFVSFYLNDIANILRTHEIPGQQLFLMRQSKPTLIEVSSKGARDKLKREINLTKEEKRRVNSSKKISGTDWKLVNLPDLSYEKEYIKNLWVEAFIIMGIIILVLFTLLFFLFRIKN